MNDFINVIKKAGEELNGAIKANYYIGILKEIEKICIYTYPYNKDINNIQHIVQEALDKKFE